MSRDQDLHAEYLRTLEEIGDDPVRAAYLRSAYRRMNRGSWVDLLPERVALGISLTLWLLILVGLPVFALLFGKGSPLHV